MFRAFPSNGAQVKIIHQIMQSQYLISQHDNIVIIIHHWNVLKEIFNYISLPKMMAE
jgi:hypothetical protein